MNQKNFDDFVHRLNTQDGRGTSYPVWEVRDRFRLYGVDPSFHDFCGFIWVNNHDTEQYFDTNEELLEYLKDEGVEIDIAEWGDEIEDGHIYFDRRYYTMKDRLINVHFTEEAANNYIRRKRHDLNDPFVYVSSQYLCQEWNDIVEMLKNGKLVLKENE